MFVLPADAEVDVLTCPENLKDLPPFGGLSRQPLDLDGVADACSFCCDGIAHKLPPWGFGGSVAQVGWLASGSVVVLRVERSGRVASRDEAPTARPPTLVRMSNTLRAWARLLSP